MNYKHLTETNRTWFERLLQAGQHAVTDMAALMGCHRSTLYRERRRNRVSADPQSRSAVSVGTLAKTRSTTRAVTATAPFPSLSPSPSPSLSPCPLSYSAKYAQARHVSRASQANRRPTIETWVYIAAHDFMVDYDLSPAQIANHLPISTEWLYRWIYREVAAGADWEKHLRSGRISRRRRRSRCPNGVDKAHSGFSQALPIAERPEASNLKLEFGHWEADLLLGRKDNTYAVLVVKERSSRLTLVCRVKSQRSVPVMRAKDLCTTEPIIGKLVEERRV